MEKFEELIRKNTSGINKDTRMEIHEITNQAPFKIPSIKLYSSSFMFNYDPVPIDMWVIVDNTDIYRGGFLIEVFKKMNFAPKSKEEALKAAKLLIFAKDIRNKVYPDFEAENCKKPNVSEKNGIYEIIVYAAAQYPRTHLTPIKYIIRLGKGVYELCEKIPKPTKGI